MYLDYRLDEKKLRSAVQAKGFASFGELLKASALHRNSLNDYIEGKRSVFSAVTRKICGILECDPLTLLARHETFPTSDTTAKALERLLQELAEKHPNIAFFLLGSRARGKHRALSDWDVAISAGMVKLPVSTYLQIKSEIEDGTENFPVEVDVINFDEAPRWFIDAINYEPKFLAGNESSFYHALGVIHGAHKN